MTIAGLSGLKTSWTLGCWAALLATAVDGLWFFAAVPFAYADGLPYLPMAFGFFAVPAFVCALLLEPLVRRFATPESRFGPPLLAALCVLAVAALGLAARDAALARLKPEFAELLSQLRAAITLGFLALSLCAGALAYLVARRSERLARPLGLLRVLLVSCAFYAIYLAHFVAEPLHLRLLGGPLVLFSLASLWLLLCTLDAPWLMRATRPMSALWVLLLLALPFGLWPWGSAPSRFLLFNHSATAGALAGGLRELADFDGDGSAPTWLLGGDCAPWNGRIGPLRAEVPGNGVDDDCRGGDAKVKAPPPPPPAEARDVRCALPGQPLSLLLITVDAMRASALSPEVTPGLVRLAERGLWFTRAYAGGGFTYHSLFVLSSGLRVSDLRADLTRAAAPKGAHLASLLRAQGYATAAFWPVRTPSGLHAGWDRMFSRVYEQESGYISHSAAANTERATRWITAQRAAAPERPYLAWLHYPDAHAPYEPPPAVSPRSASLPDYLRELEYVDFHIAKLLRDLHGSGALERAAILVTADHGEDLGAFGHEGHGVDVYESSIHVPLILYVPGCSPQRIERPVSHVRVAGTLRALAGLTSPGRGLLDGFDPSPVVAESFSDELLANDRRYKRALIAGDKKLIVDLRNDAYALFDLRRDPGEQQNLYARDAATRELLLELYQTWLDQRW